MPDETIAIIRWQSDLDQLAEGMRQHDPETERRCRMFLALLARDGTAVTIAEVIQSLSDQWELRTHLLNQKEV